MSGLRWDVSVATTSDIDEDGFPRCQADNYGRGGSKYFELSHQYGFYSRPQDPEVDNDGLPVQGAGCAVFTASDGDDTYGFLGIDPRYLESIPITAPGGSSMYAAVRDDDGSVRSPFIQLDGDDGSMTIYIPLKEQRAHLITAGYDANGEETIVIAHADGTAVIMMDNTITIKNGPGTAFLSIGPDGIVLAGNVTIAGGLSQGGPGSVPLVTAPGMDLLFAEFAKLMAAKTSPVTGAEVALAIASALAIPHATLTTVGQ